MKPDLNEIFEETYRSEEDTFSFDWTIALTMIGTALVCTLIFLSI